jgi:Tol biopolymer transport system component
MLSGARNEHAFGQTASDLFQQALRKEQLDGDLNAAIALYQRILKEHQRDRSVTSKVLVQLGGAYEKQGNAAARSAYQRVLRDYADQREQAAIASARLSALAGDNVGLRAASGPTLRRLWTNVPGAVGGITPDGRHLTFRERSSGRLGVRDVREGASRLLTDTPSRPGAAYALAGIPSPDGQQIVYPWYTEQGTVELRMIAARGGTPRVVHANPETEYVAPMDWSRDGKRVLVLLVRKDRIGQIATMSVADGRMTVLKTLGWRGVQSPMRFSPDARFIAYSVPPSNETEQRDIFVLATDGSSESVLVSKPSDETVLGWTPDGTNVLYASRENGAQSLWLAPIMSGKAAGESILARRDGDNVQPLGFTLDGAFVYSSPSPSHIRTFTALLGTSVAMRSPLTPAVDRPDAWAAQWSHSGKSLAYASQGSPNERVQLIVRTVSSGAERILPNPDLGYAYTIRWSSDDADLMVTGQDKKGRRGIFRVDPATGAATLMIAAPAGAEAAFAGWSTDGRSLIYTGVDPRDERTFGTVVLKNVLDGTEQEIVRAGTTQLGRPRVSPDGRRLAFVDVDSGGQPSKRLRVVALERAEMKDLVRVPNGSSIGALAWSPSGDELYFVLISGGQGSRASRRLMRVPENGGNPVDTGIEFEGGVIALQIHPNGEQLLCTVEIGADVGQDVWVMENFLPRATRQGKSGSK